MTKTETDKMNAPALDQLARLWSEYTRWLAEHAPEAFANLAPGASEAELEALASEIEPALPVELSAWLRLNNGQREPLGCCVLPGLEFLSTRRISEEWNKWKEFRTGETEEGLEALDDYSRALDPGVLDKYTHPGWIPAFKDGWRADFVGFDMAPDNAGVAGQVINFGRDEDKHFIAFPRAVELIQFWVALVNEGDCQVLPAEPPERPAAWFEHKRNGIDVLRSVAKSQRETRKLGNV